MLFFTFHYVIAVSIFRICCSLEEILLEDGKLYLVFEFLSMDLKKYLDSLPNGQFMDKMLVKVRQFLLNVLHVGSAGYTRRKYISFAMFLVPTHPRDWD